MIKAGIVGVTGYTGRELLRLLLEHPNVEVTNLFSSSHVGNKIGQVCENFYGLDFTLENFNPKKLPDIDVLFLALPHGKSHSIMADLLKADIKIIDLSADFRIKDVKEFEKYYSLKHDLPDMLSKAALGFPELYRKEIVKSRLCANPGCFSTAVILGLYPLAKNNLLKSSVIVDAKSGVSGAGKALKETSMFCEANETVSAYGTFVHRHTAEMEAALSVPVHFSPHLVPVNRGILASMYVDIAEKDMSKIKSVYDDFYRGEAFINIKDKDVMPSTKYVIGTNICQISFKLFPDVGKLVVFSAIDNLLKGAAGQAVQNMNLMFELKETAGLSLVPINP